MGLRAFFLLLRYHPHRANPLLVALAGQGREGRHGSDFLCEIWEMKKDETSLNTP